MAQRDLFRRVVSQLRALGYRGNLLQEGYVFEDWFAVTSDDSAASTKSVTADAAAFGRLPLGHDNACFVVVMSPDSVSGPSLITRYRALGAPLAFQIIPDHVLLWPVRPEGVHKVDQPLNIAPENLDSTFASRAQDWSPAAMLRAKNIVPDSRQAKQYDFIDLGLIPALEDHVREKLDPLLRSTFFAAMETYQRSRATQPEPGKLFRLVFRVLAGKVLTDRQMPKFRRFATAPDPDELLIAVNNHFGDKPSLIADSATRRVVVERLWAAFGLQNISAAVLSLIWENTLVDKNVRKAVGLYGTPTSLARYMVDRVGFEEVHNESERMVVEPCCGNGVFLLAAMRKLSTILNPDITDKQRHEYLKSVLSGFDIDPFGREVARDCLMLADFPNSNGWVLEEEDVFESAKRSPVFYAKLSQARFVFCNPPFTPSFSAEQREKYQAESHLKPVELLSRVIDEGRHLIGLAFVLPHQLLTGASFKKVRRKLAERFGRIEVVSLPEAGVFTGVRYKAVILIARDTRDAGSTSLLLHRTISKSDWPRFVAERIVTVEDQATVTVQQAAESIAIPELAEVWEFLQGYDTLAAVTLPLERRGIQWNKPLRTHRDILIVNAPQLGYREGVPSAPKGSFFSYLCPPTKFLSVKPEDRYRNAFDLPWSMQKVIMNANRKGSVHPWRIAAFADRRGLLAYHTFKALWPAEGWSPEVIAAILNGPVANAYVTSHETGPEITNEVLDKLPIPCLTSKSCAKIESLVNEYLSFVSKLRLPVEKNQPQAERLLLQIDAAVLDGYDLPRRLERKLLDYFNSFGDDRPVGFPVEDYFPTEFTAYFSLSEWLTGRPARATVERFRSQPRDNLPSNVLEALATSDAERDE